MLEVEQDAELRPLRAFVFGERVSESMPGATTRAKLFDALRINDACKFGEVVADLERRKLSPESDWIGDDCVVFLLLLGVSKFNAGDTLAEKLLQYRGKTTQPQVQRVNHTFDAIRRGEFAMEGEFAFIKCVYRTMSKGWTLSDSDCVKLYKQLTAPGFVDQLDPFLRLLAIRAFDLVIEYRMVSTDSGNWNQVLQKLQDEGGKLSLSQFLKLLKHLRIGVLVTIVLGLVSVFSAGQVWTWWSSKPILLKRVAPSGGPMTLSTKLADSTNGWEAPFVRYLGGEIGVSSTNLTSITLIAEADPFTRPTERFTAKGKFLLVSNVNALCFLMRPVNGLMSSIPVEVSCKGNEFSASVPSCEAGDQLRFLVRGLAGNKSSLDSLAPNLKVNVAP